MSARPVPPTVSWIAERRAISAARVAAGRAPLHRLSVPTAASAFVDERSVVWAEPAGPAKRSAGRPMICDGVTPRPLKLADVEPVLAAETAHRLVFADEAALRSTLALIRRCGQVVGRPADRVAGALGYLAGQPRSGRVLVATAAAARRFWLPAGSTEASLAAWARAFRLPAGASAPFLAAELVRRCAAPAARDDLPGLALVSRADGPAAALARSLFRGRSSDHVVAYREANALAECWGAVERTDPLLREWFALNGEVVSFEPRKLLGGLIEGPVSTPCKLRPGKVLVVSDDGKTCRFGEVNLVNLGFDGGLTARFAKGPGKPAKGYILLDQAQAARKAVWITTAPFGGSASPGGAWRWVTARGGERPGARDIPLDVILAGRR